MLYLFKDYVQETGRGGRDGKGAHCILFYRDQNIHTAMSVLDIRGKETALGDNEKDALHKLEAVKKVRVVSFMSSNYIQFLTFEVPHE